MQEEEKQQIDAQLKKDLHREWGFNIVAFDTQKVRINREGKRMTGPVMLPHTEQIDEWLLQAERWGVAMSSDSSKCNGVILLDWDEGQCPERLKRFMCRTRVKGGQVSMHGIVSVQGASRSRCKQFVKTMGYEGLEMFTEKRNLVLFGEYEYDVRGEVHTSEWKWKDDQVSTRQVVKVVQGDELTEAGLTQKKKRKSIKNNNNTITGDINTSPEYIKELVETGPENSRHDWCWEVGRYHINTAGGDITSDDLAEKIVGSILDCKTFKNAEDFVSGGSRYESDVRRTARDILSSYEPDKSGVVKQITIGGKKEGDSKEKRVIKYHDLAQDILDMYQIVATPVNKQLYWFDRNCWYPCEMNLESVVTKKHADWHITPGARRIIIEIIRDYAHRPADETQSDDIFDLDEQEWVFTNGQLNVLTGKFTESVDSQLYNTIKMPFDYDPAATCPVFDKSIREWCDDDMRKITALDEAYALAMMRDSDVQTAHFIYGVGLNGKSTWLRALCAMLPKGRYSDMSIAEMAYDNFWGSSVYGKMLIMSGDGSGWTLRDVSRFKKLVGKDEISVEFKNQNKFTYKPKCHVIQVFNELPTPLDRSNGFFRKVQLVEFNRVFEVNPELEKEILRELPGVFNRVLPHIRRLITTGVLQQPYTLDETRKIWGAADDYVREYVEKYILEWISGAMTPSTKDVYVSYQQEYEDPNKIDMVTGREDQIRTQTGKSVQTTGIYGGHNRQGRQQAVCIYQDHK